MTLATHTLSSSGLSRGPSRPHAPEAADGWMVGTSPTMTNETRKLIGVSLEGSGG
jgi:hypothetical protein